MNNAISDSGAGTRSGGGANAEANNNGGVTNNGGTASGINAASDGGTASNGRADKDGGAASSESALANANTKRQRGSDGGDGSAISRGSVKTSRKHEELTAVIVAPANRREHTTHK